MKQDSKFHNIPQELKDIDQWVCWRFKETKDNQKPTKVPYDANVHSPADVTRSLNWCSFDKAVEMYRTTGLYSGIGFCLTDNDPFTGIDLDAVKDPALQAKQTEIYEKLPSYAERSPSKNGLHIIVKATLPRALKRKHVEMYDQKRFLTMTGDVYRKSPIIELQQPINEIFTDISGGSTQNTVMVENKPETLSDDGILSRAMNASNGEKFRKLYEGNWENDYPSQSEADLAFMNIIVFYTQNIEQIKRIFWDSALGKRQKASRTDYIQGLITKAFDQHIKLVDITPPNNFEHFNLKPTSSGNDKRPYAKILEDIMALCPQTPLEPPPGLLGDIAQFIYRSSPRPVSEIATAAAIGLMAGITGRAYNVSGTGLNQYILALAPSGTGKEAIHSGISKIINSISYTQKNNDCIPAAKNFIGPAEFASGQALLQLLNEPDHRCFVSILGEFGLKMQQLSHPNAKSHETLLKKVLLDLYHKSGKDDVLGSMQYAQKDRNTENVQSPSVSIIGESTPETFYRIIDEDTVKSGLLPRFIIIEYDDDCPELNKSHSSEKLSPELSKELINLCKTCIQFIMNNKVQEVGIEPDALELLNQVEELTRELMNATKTDAIRCLWNRVHLKILRLAALVAVGTNHCFPQITVENVRWAYKLVLKDVLNINNKFSKGETGLETNEVNQVNKLIQVTVKYITEPYENICSYKFSKEMYDNKIIPHSFLSRNTSNIAAFKNDKIGSSKALERAIKSLIDDGDIEMVMTSVLKEQYNFSGKAYRVINYNRFLDDK